MNVIQQLTLALLVLAVLWLVVAKPHAQPQHVLQRTLVLSLAGSNRAVVSDETLRLANADSLIAYPGVVSVSRPTRLIWAVWLDERLVVERAGHVSVALEEANRRARRALNG